MKKLFTLFLLGSCLSISAQSIILTSPPTASTGLISPGTSTVINNDTITYCVDDFVFTFENAKVEVINNTGSSMDIKVKRFGTETSCFNSNQFCWTICYNPAVSVSPDAITVAAGDSTDMFHGWMSPNGNEGCCFLKYRFFNANDTTQFAETTIKYCFSNNCSDAALAIEDNMINNNVSVYPNPASQEVFVNYYANTSSEVIINVYDALGKNVYSTTSTSVVGDNTTKIITATLTNGVYTCNITSGNKTITRKMIINK